MTVYSTVQPTTHSSTTRSEDSQVDGSQVRIIIVILVCIHIYYGKQETSMDVTKSTTILPSSTPVTPSSAFQKQEPPEVRILTMILTFSYYSTFCTVCNK